MQVEPGGVGYALMGIAIAAVLYLFMYLFLLPFFVYRKADAANAGIFLLLNFVVGWTIIGWCLLMLVALGESNRRRAR